MPALPLPRQRPYAQFIWVGEEADEAPQSATCMQMVFVLFKQVLATFTVEDDATEFVGLPSVLRRLNVQSYFLWFSSLRCSAQSVKQ